MRRLAALLLVAPFAMGCSHSVSGCDADAPASRFISCVLSFTPGPGAGHGQDRFPEVIEGPPMGLGPDKGSTDVLSLGKGGEIAFGFGGGGISDGDGPDFLVFENAFVVGGNAANVFHELGEVSVSEDGEQWVTFPCKQDAYPFTGCAGWNPVLSNPDNGISPLDPTRAGGDPFDLADVGLTHARFVKIRDISNYGAADNAGFDLDGAAVVNP